MHKWLASLGHTRLGMWQKTQIIFIDNQIINPQFINLNKRTAKEYYIEYNSKNIEVNIVLKIKEREREREEVI